MLGIRNSADGSLNALSRKNQMPSVVLMVRRCLPFRQSGPRHHFARVLMSEHQERIDVLLCWGIDIARSYAARSPITIPSGAYADVANRPSHLARIRFLLKSSGLEVSDHCTPVPV